MEDVKVNFMAGVHVMKADPEKLIRDSEKLEVIKRYVKATDFVSKEIFLALMGENGEGESTDAKI